MDVFAGGIWSQRIKQFLLMNGVAVMHANAYVSDGWESWEEQWSGSYDPPFFRALAAEMKSSNSTLGNLDPRRVAFRGCSGSAQMVSWLINLQAGGRLPGLTIGAGVMMAGGSHACYSSPGEGAINQCAHCLPDENAENKPGALGCSDSYKERNLTAPYCMLCCPTNFTEAYYHAHPEAYPSHPPTFLIQTEIDQGADSCAAKHYHGVFQHCSTTVPFLGLPCLFSPTGLLTDARCLQIQWL